MHKHITILITGLILLSCGGSKQFLIESWYILSDDSTQTDRKLIQQIFYDKNGIKEKEIVYNPSETIFQKETDFDIKGNKMLEITYYDSTKLIGTQIQYDYNDNVLTKVVAIGLNGSEKADTTIMTFQNELDSLNRLSKSMTINGNDTNIIEYRYTDFDKISNMLSKSGNNLISYENFYYNDNNQTKEYIIRIPDYGIEKHEFYYYADTLLTKRVLINNSDTILIENYVYNDTGLKTNINKKDFKKNKTLRIKIEYN